MSKNPYDPNYESDKYQAWQNGHASGWNDCREETVRKIESLKKGLRSQWR